LIGPPLKNGDAGPMGMTLVDTHMRLQPLYVHLELELQSVFHQVILYKNEHLNKYFPLSVSYVLFLDELEI
jgi:hypothetical protein